MNRWAAPLLALGFALGISTRADGQCEGLKGSDFTNCKNKQGQGEIGGWRKKPSSAPSQAPREPEPWEKDEAQRQARYRDSLRQAADSSDRAEAAERQRAFLAGMGAASARGDVLSKTATYIQRAYAATPVDSFADHAWPDWSSQPYARGEPLHADFTPKEQADFGAAAGLHAWDQSEFVAAGASASAHARWLRGQAIQILRRCFAETRSSDCQWVLLQILRLRRDVVPAAWEAEWTGGTTTTIPDVGGLERELNVPASSIREFHTFDRSRLSPGALDSHWKSVRAKGVEHAAKVAEVRLSAIGGTKSMEEYRSRRPVGDRDRLVSELVDLAEFGDIDSVRATLLRWIAEDRRTKTADDDTLKEYPTKPDSLVLKEVRPPEWETLLHSLGLGRVLGNSLDDERRAWRAGICDRVVSVARQHGRKDPGRVAAFVMYAYQDAYRSGAECGRRGNWSVMKMAGAAISPGDRPAYWREIGKQFGYRESSNFPSEWDFGAPPEMRAAVRAGVAAGRAKAAADAAARAKAATAESAAVLSRIALDRALAEREAAERHSNQSALESRDPAAERAVAERGIPSLNALVNGIRFFETDAGLPDAANRRYTTEFNWELTHFIYVELSLIHPPPGQFREIPVTCMYRYPTGREYTFSWTLRVEATRASATTTQGWGSATPGAAYPVGTYGVECSAEGHAIAHGSFTVVSTRAKAGMLARRALDLSRRRAAEGGTTFDPTAPLPVAQAQALVGDARTSLSAAEGDLTDWIDRLDRAERGLRAAPALDTTRLSRFSSGLDSAKKPLSELHQLLASAECTSEHPSGCLGLWHWAQYSLGYIPGKITRRLFDRRVRERLDVVACPEGEKWACYGAANAFLDLSKDTLSTGWSGTPTAVAQAMALGYSAQACVLELSGGSLGNRSLCLSLAECLDDVRCGPPNAALAAEVRATACTLGDHEACKPRP